MIEATANILIGGKSQRFGSEKWKTKLGSHMILDHIWNSCINFKYQNLIGKKKPENIDKPFILDQYNTQAPIIGLHSAINSSNTKWVLLLSCDLPLINKDCLKFIWDSKAKKIDAVVPITKTQAQPLCSLYNVNILNKLDSSIKNKKFSLKNFLKSINTQFIKMNKYEKLFFNMNTQKDLKKIKLIYRNKPSY